jgi:hypothetical protein
MESYLRDYIGDRENREIIAISTKEQKSQISYIQTFYNVQRHIHNFTKSNAGICYEFDPCSIADIDAEYIRISRDVIVEWFNKNLFIFMAKSVLREDPNALFRFDLDNKKPDLFFETIIAEDVFHDYSVAASINTLHSEIWNEKSMDHEGSKFFKEMLANIDKAEQIKASIGLNGLTIKNLHYKNKAKNAFLDKKSLQKSEK